MARKIRRHFKTNLPVKKPKVKEVLHKQTGNIPLNKAQTDRISFSVQRNNQNNLRKIENISYEISFNGNWEWVVRYDDHGGSGRLHRHFRVNLNDDSEVESTAGIKKYRNKDFELTWVCNDIKRNYLTFRSRFLRRIGLDLY